MMVFSESYFRRVLSPNGCRLSAPLLSLMGLMYEEICFVRFGRRYVGRLRIRVCIRQEHCRYRS